MTERKRFRDVEVRRLMLDAGAAWLAESGLAISLDHLRLEEVIAGAGVPRSSAYRQWGTKDAFLLDLLRDMAGTNQPTLADDASSWRTLSEVTLADPGRTATAEGRLAVVSELLRRGTVEDFQRMIDSEAWRVHLMLKAAASGLSDPTLRSELAERLAAAEEAAVAQLAARYAAVADALGVRLREPGPDWQVLVRMVLAQMRGAAITALSNDRPHDDALTVGPHDDALTVGPVDDALTVGPVDSEAGCGDGPWHPVAWAVAAILLAAVERG